MGAVNRHGQVRTTIFNGPRFRSDEHPDPLSQFPSKETAETNQFYTKMQADAIMSQTACQVLAH